MRRFLKLFGIIIGGLVVLLLAVALVLPLVIDADDFKPRIEAAVEDATGRDFEIRGDISLSVFPWLGVELGETRLGQARGFGDEDFASMQGVKVGLRLLPLLQKKLDVDRIEILAPIIRLERNAEGVGNWEDLAAAKEDADAGAAEPDGQQSPGLPEFAVAGIAIDNGSLEFKDATSGQRVRIDKLDIQTGNISLPLDTDMDASFGFRVEQGGEAVANGELQLRTRLRADLDSGRYAFDELALDIDVLPAALGAPLPLRLSLASASADLDTSTAMIEGLQLAVHEARLEADATVTGMDAEPRVKAGISMSEFNLAKLLGQLGIELPEMRAADALSSFTLDADLEASANQVMLARLDASLDQSRLQGSAGLADLEKQAVRFDLEVDRFDADRYLAPVDEEAGVADQEGEALDLDAIPLPVEPLRKLDAKGKASIGELGILGMTMSNVSLGVEAANGNTRLHPFSADFYDGGYRGDIRLSVKGDSLAVDARENIEKFSISPMLRDLAEIDRLSGSVSMTVNTRAVGRTAGDWARDVDGDFTFEASNGAIEGFNLWAKLREARAKIRNEEFDVSAYPQRTEFADLKTRGDIVDGVIQQREIVARLPYLGVTGSGSLKPLEGSMDYSLDVSVLDKPEIDPAMSELKGVTVPVTIRGEIASPKVRPDVAGALEAKAKARTQEQVDEKKDELKKKLDDKLRDIFGG